MKSTFSIQRILRPAVAGACLAALALPAAAVDLKTADGSWTFSITGEVNVDYIWSSCQSASSAVAVAGGLTCVGSASTSNVSNVGNGLLPAAFSFGVATTQDGFDLAAHLGLYPGIATNDGGSPNLQAGASNGSSNTALGSTGLDLRQVYMTFGNKDMGTFTLGRNIGLFGADVILADMTLLGVGAPGSAASAAPSNTTLGGIGFGYIYTDWLAQIDYTTPDFSGFALTVGIFDPINSLSDAGTVEPKKAPGLHGKLSYTLPIADGTKFYFSVATLTQQQDYQVPNLTPPPATTTNEYRVAGWTCSPSSMCRSWRSSATTTMPPVSARRRSLTSATSTTRRALRTATWRRSTYKIGAVKLGVNYGESNLDFADAADQAANPTLVREQPQGHGRRVLLAHQEPDAAGGR